jgi:hypothetical protein
MITRTRNSVVLVFALATGACGGASVREPPAVTTNTVASSLDGASYDVTLLFPGEAPKADTLRFSDGKFESTACTPLGFPQWADYRVRSEESGLSFEATTRHPSGTTMEWRVSVRGGSVEGTVTRTMNGQRSVASVKGSRRG